MNPHAGALGPVATLLQRACSNRVYTLGKLLGEGGFGKVFEARSEMGSMHAVKVVEDQDAYDHEIGMLDAIKKLQCAFLIKMEEFFKDQASGALCIVMPLAHGGTLKDAM
jgi:serine/threonine protein kinase